MRHVIQMTNPRLAGAVELAFVDQQQRLRRPLKQDRFEVGIERIGVPQRALRVDAFAGKNKQIDLQRFDLR